MTDRDKLLELLGDCWHMEGYGIDLRLKFANYLLDNNVIVLPCREGDTVYKIVKFCGENTGYKEAYKPNKEFKEECPYLEKAEWYDDSDECKAVEDYFERQYCTLNLKIFCDKCKERLAIQKDIFTLSMAHQVYNSPMFNSKTELGDIYFRTLEEAEKVLKEIVK